MTDSGSKSRSSSPDKSSPTTRTPSTSADSDSARTVAQEAQHRLGNAGMQALLGLRPPSPRDARLRVGASASPAERDADRMADAAMRRNIDGASTLEASASLPSPQPRTTLPTAVCARRASATDAGVRVAPPAVHRALNTPGQPLEPSIRREMGARFGVDFGRVRVHTDPMSAQSAQAIGARAYTHGHDIVFGTGMYRPESMPGKTLLAHELAHVLQGGDALRRDGEDEEAAAEAERESSWLDMLWSVLQTIGGGLLGEFNEDAGFAEIGVDLGVSLIPYLDQASDVRDLAAHLYFMCFRDGELARPMRWVGLAFTLIGLFPEIGSAIKGASKLLIRGGRSVLEHLDDLMRIVRRLLGSASATLDDFVDLIRRSWPEISRFGRELWFAKLAEVRRMLDEVPSLFRSQVQPLIDIVEDIWRRSPRMLDEAMASIDEMMRAGFEALGVRMDGSVFAMADGPPGFFMSSHSDEIAEEMGRLSGGGRSLSEWTERNLDEAEEIAEDLVEAGAGAMRRMEEHHSVFVYLLNAISSRMAGRSTPVAGRVFRDIVDDLFPQRLVRLEPGVHDLMHMEFWRIFDEVFEPDAFMARLQRGLSETDISLSGSIVERAGAPGMLRRLRSLQQVTERELIDIVEETYLRIFRENPGLIPAGAQREIIEQIDEVRRML